MTQETIRVYDLANELKISNKEVIELLEKKVQIKVKSHSSTLTLEQVKRFKELLKEPSQKVSSKPKAFIVKKAKPQTPEVKEETPNIAPTQEKRVVDDKKEQVVIKPRLGPKIIQRAEDRFKQQTAQKKEHANNNRPTPQGKPPVKNDRPMKGQQPAQQQNRPERNTKPTPEIAPQNQDKKPIKRHIISQDIYEKGSSKKKASAQGKDRTRSKEEEQERISLEKAMAQKHKKRPREEQKEEVVTQVVINQAMTIGELADKIKKSSAEVVKFLMMQGIMATVNEVIDVEIAKKVAQNFDLEVLEEDLDAFMEEELEKEEKANALKNIDEKLLKHRAPVVSIMGHVDHGKTTLLDSIRAAKHKIVATEVGGITQSIGAYTVYLDNKKIVFIDTPGHEAFTEMRARGAKATDIAILVVAADDGIMPQTIEAINHAKAADVPIIIAINKMDKPTANPDRILQQLTEHGLVPEAWGGDTVCVKVSAIQGTGIDELLEYILLTAEMQDLKAYPEANATGVVIEANLDKGKGPVATLLVQNGTMKVGDCVVVGSVGGRVRALLSDSGERVKKAPPSTPVEVLGLSEVPQAGDSFEVVDNEREMKQIVAERKEKERITKLEAMKPAHVRSDIVGSDEEVKNLNIIIKANTHGSAEAVSQAVMQLESKEILTKLIHVGVGDISEADVMLAAASNAIILGFTVREDANALAAAERENVSIKKYDIIYKVLEDLEQTMLGLLQPEVKEVALGKAEVRQIFTVGKTMKIAGCYVLEGKIKRGEIASVIRNGQEIFKGQVDQLKRFKDDVKEVAQGFECGLSFAKFNDLQEGDIIDVSTRKEIERQSLV